MVEVEETIYVIGGKGSKGTIEVFDKATDQWKLLEGLKMKNENEEYVACVLERII